MPDDLVSESRAAQILGVSRQRVAQIRAEGTLTPVRGRTPILYHRVDVDRLRAERGTRRYGRT
jgi:hypothetical protein